MNAVNLVLPQSLYEELETVALKEGISVNDFITVALAEKLASLATVDYLAQRAKRGSREKLLAVLAKAPDAEPEECDRM